MPLQTFGTSLVPFTQEVMRPDYSGFGDFIKNYQAAQVRPEQQQLSLEGMREGNRAASIQNRLQEQYGDELMRSKIAQALAQRKASEAKAASEMTPEQKIAFEVAKKRALNQAQAESEREFGTSASRTQEQKIIRGANALVPALDDIIESDYTAFQLLKPSERKAYNQKINSAAETIVSAFGWPTSGESLHAAREMIMKSPWESHTNYQDRIRTLKDDVELRRSLAQQGQYMEPPASPAAYQAQLMGQRGGEEVSRQLGESTPRSSKYKNQSTESLKEELNRRLGR